MVSHQFATRRRHRMTRIKEFIKHAANAYKCSLERISYRQMALAFIRAVMFCLGLGENI